MTANPVESPAVPSEVSARWFAVAWPVLLVAGVMGAMLLACAPFGVERQASESRSDAPTPSGVRLSLCRSVPLFCYTDDVLVQGQQLHVAVSLPATRLELFGLFQRR